MPCVVDVVGGQCLGQSMTSPSGSASSSAISRTSALGLVGGALDQLANLVVGLVEARQHVAGDDVGVGRVRPPDADAHPPEVRSAEPLGEALQAVVAGEPAAEAAANLAERQVDLVVDDDRALERHLQRAARRAGGGARLVHVGLRAEHRDPRASRRRRGPRRSGRGSAPSARGSSQRRSSSAGDLEADVVAAVRRSATRDCRGRRSAGADRRPRPGLAGGSAASQPAQQRQGPLLPFGFRSPRRGPRPPPGPRPREPPRPRAPRPPRRRARPPPRARARAPPRRAAATAWRSSPRRRRRPRRARTSTPSGAATAAELERVADRHPGDVGGDALGDLGRQRLDRDLVGHVLEHAALLHARRLLAARAARSRPRPRSPRRASPRAGRDGAASRARGRAAAP